MRTASCLVALSIVTCLAAGCARTSSSPSPAVPASLAVAPAAPVAQEEASDDAAHASSESAAFTQKPGDYVVYRFSGGFRKTPLLLTQRIVEATDVLLVVDLTLDDGAHKTSVRARYTHAPGATHEVASVARIDAAGSEKPMTLAEFDTLMAQTALTADDNEGSTGSEQVTVAVGGHDLPCTRTRYQVVLGKHHATMSTLTSDAFPWGDVGGEITSDQGRVLYRAEVVDVGSAGPIVSALR